MKGGRTAPRNDRRPRAEHDHLTRFNEGGADCPPKLVQQRAVRSQLINASMKGGRTAPRNQLFQEPQVAVESASMKGGRTAPRNLRWRVPIHIRTARFNEGGADCPPKRCR